MPAIPAFYGAHWYEYSTNYWTNWPNEKNPYWFRPAPFHNTALPTLFGITPKGTSAPSLKWLNTKDKGGILVPTSEIFANIKRK